MMKNNSSYSCCWLSSFHRDLASISSSHEHLSLSLSSSSLRPCDLPATPRILHSLCKILASLPYHQTVRTCFDVFFIWVCRAGSSLVDTAVPTLHKYDSKAPTKKCSLPPTRRGMNSRLNPVPRLLYYIWTSKHSISNDFSLSQLQTSGRREIIITKRIFSERDPIITAVLLYINSTWYCTVFSFNSRSFTSNRWIE